MMKRTILTTTILALSSVLMVSLVGVYADTSIQMPGSQWAILELADGKILNTHADTIPGGGGVEFLFPDATASPPGFETMRTDDSARIVVVRMVRFIIFSSLVVL